MMKVQKKKIYIQNKNINRLYFMEIDPFLVRVP